jgi:hypothetical protein
VKPAGNPWMKFYPADWRSDPALRSCTIGARGLWIEMMAIMHEAEPYGSLLVKGKRVDKKQLAALAGVPERECTVLLLELEGMGVFERDIDGMIYSRRMRRDHAKAIKDKANGKGGGNPRLKNGVNPPDKGEDKAQKPEARVDRIGSAGASGLTPGSKALADAFWRALGIDGPLQIPPHLAGIDVRAIEWERAGWSIDLIATEARRIGPDKPLTYHEKVFATAFAKRQAPLPIVEIRQAETITVTHGKPKSAVIQAIDDLNQRIAGFDDPGGSDELRGAAGQAPPRLLSHG